MYICISYVCAQILLLISGSGSVINKTATVTVNGLQCGVTYTIIAGGTRNGDLVGPRSSFENVIMADCPTVEPPGSYSV